MQVRTIALVGNPNVGKSTLFNSLTGMRRHTGNWTGKTLDCAAGYAKRSGKKLLFVDLPGMYAYYDGKDMHSEEEAAAVAFLEQGQADLIAIVCDAGALERNLILVLQLLHRVTCPIALVLNLQKEAEAHGVTVDAERLQARLGIPVLMAEANDRMHVRRLATELAELATVCSDSDAERAEIVDFAATASEIAAEAVTVDEKRAERQEQRARRFDRFLTGRISGSAVMLLLLLGIFWITMVGANACSDMLMHFFACAEQWLWRSVGELLAHSVAELLLGGVLRTVFWVVAVMLPPMAIFFPLFTFLEDLGYLPRVAFDLDHVFCRCKSCGKQALTMCMGLGCNAVGVMGCRIIDSPRERKIAMLTCSLMPCNGRLPMLCTMISVFLTPQVGAWGGMLSALIMLLCILLCVGITFASCALLSSTVLRGEPSTFVLELPAFRKPCVGQILVRSVLDRTIRMLGRAVVVAAPAGALLWGMARISIAGRPLSGLLVTLLEGPGRLMGMDGVILAAFLLALPANEIAVPIMLMLYQSQGTLGEMGSWEATWQLLSQHGWTRATVVCVLAFILFHWPCATTLMTIHKETHSWRMVLLGFLIPTTWGCLICFLLARLFDVVPLV